MYDVNVVYRSLLARINCGETCLMDQDVIDLKQLILFGLAEGTDAGADDNEIGEYIEVRITEAGRQYLIAHA
ncbi:hypothetical protein D3C84_858570 [compost metagenome]|uniref:hypothetical protein n=1 Tax=Pseudomonas sp. GL-R-19 TaxID=2832391 RepID=UPI000FB1CEF5|nr:hypothetical protein [Pseudomonas sp. GL-R-19]